MPPVPDRLAEIRMIDRIEKNWIDQPYNRYYMQEDVRKSKMDYSGYNLNVLLLPPSHAGSL